jgi:mevalonate kinase
LLPNPVDEAPYTTYERLDDWVEDLPLVLGSTGVQHNSGDVHGKMRPRYIAEHLAYQQRGGEMPPMVGWMSGAWASAWRGKIALLKRDWQTFGRLMNENHRLVNEMMNYCGFSDGAGWANNLLIESSRSHALGAKLTGAGGGGSVFALTFPGKEAELMETWQNTAREHNLHHALIQSIQIARHGLRIEEA